MNMKYNSVPVVCGVDEVGRGAAAGDVFAAACVLPAHFSIPVRDSKKLTAKQRESMSQQIQSCAVAWAIGRATQHEIDTMNILKASLLAMERAVLSLQMDLDLILVDGNWPLTLKFPCRCIIGGDDSEPVISAASILAKVERDAYMVELDRLYPGYSFAKNKGYLTQEHREALRTIGPCKEHRFSYRPVQEAAGCVSGIYSPTLFERETK